MQRDTVGSFQWVDGPVAITPGWAPWEDEDGTLISGDGPCFVMDLSRDQWESVPCTSFQAFMCKKGAGMLNLWTRFCILSISNQLSA